MSLTSDNSSIHRIIKSYFSLYSNVYYLTVKDTEKMILGNDDTLPLLLGLLSGCVLEQALVVIYFTIQDAYCLAIIKNKELRLYQPFIGLMKDDSVEYSRIINNRFFIVLQKYFSSLFLEYCNDSILENELEDTELSSLEKNFLYLIRYHNRYHSK